MLICHCEAVNDRAIRGAIAAGARGPDDLAEMCGAGRRCGSCVPAILQLLAEAHVDVQRPQSKRRQRVSAAA